MDRRAVIDMPLRLTLTLLIISLSLPVADAALQMQEREAALRDCEAEAQRILDAALELHFQGLGSSRALHVSLPEDSALVIDDGGALHIEHKGQRLSSIHDHARLPMHSDGELVIEGRASLVLRAEERGGSHGVWVGLR